MVSLILFYLVYINHNQLLSFTLESIYLLILILFDSKLDSWQWFFHVNFERTIFQDRFASDRRII